MAFFTVARAGEIAPGGSKVVEAGGKTLALFHVDGAIHAIDHECPHAYGPLGEGQLDGRIVTCPWHCWTFDVTTGASPSVPGVRVDRYPVRLLGEEVQVELGG